MCAACLPRPFAAANAALISAFAWCASVAIALHFCVEACHKYVIAYNAIDDRMPGGASSAGRAGAGRPACHCLRDAGGVWGRGVGGPEAWGPFGR